VSNARHAVSSLEVTRIERNWVAALLSIQYGNQPAVLDSSANFSHDRIIQ